MFGSYHLLLSVSYFSLGSFPLSPLFHTANLGLFSLARRDSAVRTTLSLPATFIISPPSPLPPYPRRPHPSSTTANFPTSSLQALLSSNFSLQSLASRNHFTADTPPSELILVPYLCALGCSRGSRRKMVVEHHAICRPRRALNYQASRVAVFVVFVYVAKRTVLFSCYCGRIENVT